jgi:hypothetical protein
VTNEASSPAPSATNEAIAPTDREPNDGPPTATNEAISEPGAPTATNEANSEHGQVQGTGTSLVFPDPPVIPLAMGVDRTGPPREDEPEPRAESPVRCSLSTVMARPCAPIIVIAGACASVLEKHAKDNLRALSQPAARIRSGAPLESTEGEAWNDSA